MNTNPTMTISKSNHDYVSLWNQKYLTLPNILEIAELADLQSRLNLSNARQILYHAINKINSVPTCKCGTELKWNNDARIYRTYCSKKCTATFSIEARKETCLKKYGVDHFSKTKEFSDQIEKTSLEKFGVTHYAKTQEFKQAMVSSNLEKYGTNHPMQNADFVNAFKQRLVETIGVDNPSKLPATQEKIRQTNLEKYGVGSVFQSNDIQEKIKQTNLKKYGVTNVAQNPEISRKISNTRKQNYYDPEILTLLQDKNWLALQNKNGLSIGALADTLGVSASNLCKLFHQMDIDIIRHFSSSHEKIITDFLDSIGISYQTNTRSVINPFELDIFIPSLSLAIEINGGYWHHEDQGKHKTYHLTKTQLCEEQGIELWHLFDWEIESKFNIVTSKIFHRLGKNKKIYARRLTVRVITPKQKKCFEEQNHLQGSCVSKINLGLVDADNNIHAIMTFGGSRFTNKYQWELLRFCSSTNEAVVGGASKLLSYFKKHYMKANEIIVSYCNLRFSTGKLYKSLGFTYSHSSPPNYFYVTKNGKYAGSRNQWQKHVLKKKLPIFDPALSELDNMNLNEYHRIWDCGQHIYTYTYE